MAERRVAFAVGARSRCSARGARSALGAQPAAPGLPRLHSELLHFRALFDVSARKLSGGRAALPLQDVSTATHLAELVGQAFPVGWVRTHIHPDLPPELGDVMVPAFFGLPANSKLISFEKGCMASVRVATAGGVRRVVQGRFTEVGQHVRAVKGKGTEVPWGVDTFEWLMREATADGIKDMITDGTPLFWGSVDVGDALYSPAGAVCLDSTGQEDSVGVRIPIIAQWDELATQEFTACQADWAQHAKSENPSVEQALRYLTRMLAQSGVQPGGEAPIWAGDGAPPAQPPDTGDAARGAATASTGHAEGTEEEAPISVEGGAAAIMDKARGEETPNPEEGDAAANVDKEGEEENPNPEEGDAAADVDKAGEEEAEEEK